jgi:hypothetical protein
MPDPNLTLGEDFAVKRLLSVWGHAFASIAETMNPGSPVEFLHARLADGTIITWDEGTVSFSCSGEGAMITLEQIEAENAQW